MVVVFLTLKVPPGLFIEMKPGGQGAALEIVGAGAGTASPTVSCIGDRVSAAGLVEGAGAIVADNFIICHRQGAFNQIVGAVARGIITKG